jgi:hypothetical protein
MNSKLNGVLFCLLVAVTLCACNLTSDWCCEVGILNSKSSRMCVDYTALSQFSPNDTCKYIYTICCNNNNKHEECARGKAFAYKQESCYDPQRLLMNPLETYNDAFSVNKTWLSTIISKTTNNFKLTFRSAVAVATLGSTFLRTNSNA